MTRTKKTTGYVGEPLAKYWLLTSFGETDSDSGVTWTKKTSYVGGPLVKFWFLTSVGETDSDSGVTWTGKKKLRGVTPYKILVAYFSW